MNTLLGTLIGKLTKDPEMKSTQNGQMLVFDLPVKMGKERQTSWVEVAVSGKRAEQLQNRLRKDTIVSVTGQLELRTWEGRDGTQTKLAIAFPSVQLIDGYGSSGGSNDAPPAHYGGGFGDRPF